MGAGTAGSGSLFNLTSHICPASAEDRVLVRLVLRAQSDGIS